MTPTPVAKQSWPIFKPCTDCGTPADYNYEFDAFFCRTCNVWLERGCSDPECDFCARRPERPVQVAPAGALMETG